MTKSSKKPAATAKPAAKAPSKAATKSAVPAAVPAAASKLGKAKLTDLIVTRTGLTKKDAGAALNATLEVMAEALKSEQTIGLPGVGTLSVKATAARTGVRPGTSEKLQIPAGKKVAFKIAADLKKSL